MKSIFYDSALFGIQIVFRRDLSEKSFLEWLNLITNMVIIQINKQ